SFPAKTVGSNLAITVTGITLSGTDAANYTVSQPTALTASITRAPLAVTGVSANDKIYNGNATATLDTSGAALAGVLAGDTVTVDTSSASGTFVDALVGGTKPVTVTGVTIGGADSGNYTLSQPTGLTANITAKSLTVSGITAANKAYDA